LVELVQLVGSEMAPIKRFEDLECGKALRELTNKTNKTNKTNATRAVNQLSQSNKKRTSELYPLERES
jgi:hypothetical protein